MITSRKVTARRAAELLGVSDTYMTMLMETGKIPYNVKMNGTREVDFMDLLDFREKRDRAIKDSLNRLSQDAMDSGLYERTLTVREPEDT